MDEYTRGCIDATALYVESLKKLAAGLAEVKPFVPITVGAPEGYPRGHFAAGGDPYGITFNAADPGDAEKLEQAAQFAQIAALPR